MILSILGIVLAYIVGSFTLYIVAAKILIWLATDDTEHFRQQAKKYLLSALIFGWVCPILYIILILCIEPNRFPIYNRVVDFIFGVKK